MILHFRSALRMILDILPALLGKRLILASASPRRIELLQRLGLAPLVVPSTFPENLPHGNDPSGYALATAKAKALDVASSLIAKGEDWDLLLACDSIVVDSLGAILEKPADEAHAAIMMRSLSSRTSQVISAVILLSRHAPGPGAASNPDGLPVEVEHLSHGDLSIPIHLASFAETTTVRFAPLSEPLISAYVASGAWRGKAGGYGIQDVAAQFITGIEGDYYNVMGLPLHKTCAALRQMVG